MRWWAWLVLSTTLISAFVRAQDGGVVVAPVLLARPSITYPASADGGVLDVTVQLTVDETGAVMEARVRPDTPAPFACQALHAATRLEFSPATLDGVPHPSVLTWDVHFEPPPAPTPPPLQAVVHGLLRARGTRQPLAEAFVQSDDGAETTTDAEGAFELALTPGRHELTVRASHHAPATFTETLAQNQRLEVVYGLTPTAINPFETVVRGERQRTELARVDLSGAELHDVPGTLGDPFRVVMLLPGVSSPVSGLGYPVVRGASPSATGTFIDGVRVPQLFHAFLGPAVIHPDFIDSLDFYAGGAPVSYGRLLGGVVDARLSRRPADRLQVVASVDLLNAGVFARVPISSTGTTLTMAALGSYTGLLVGVLSPVVAPETNARLVAEFWDYQARVEQRFAGGKAQLFAFGSSDAFGSASTLEHGDSSIQKVTFHRVDARYQHALGPGEVTAQFTFGDDRFVFFASQPTGDEVSVPGQRDDSTTIGQQTFTTQARWQAELVSGLTLSTGGQWDHLRASTGLERTLRLDGAQPVTVTGDTPVAVGDFVSGWVEATFTRLERLSVTGGVRVDLFHLEPDVNQASADPRLSARWALSDDVALRASVGVYHQPPTFLLSLPVVDIASVAYGLQSVVQTSAGVTWKTWGGLELTADAYVNPMPRTQELGVLQDDEVQLPLPDENGEGSFLTPPASPSRPGRAYGLDLMLRWPLQGHFFGWVTLSLQRSERYLTYTTYGAHGEVTGGEQAWLASAFDQTVVSNLVASYRFDSGWQVGAALHLNTGRPESGDFGNRTKVAGTTPDGRPAWLPVSRDAVDRLPPFFRLDVRVSKTWILDTVLLELFLDVFNVTVRSEVVGYSYKHPGGAGLVKLDTSVPVILPSLGVKGRY